MTKFEEEVKRPKKAYIDPFSKRDVDFTGVAKKFTEGAQTLKEWKEYAFLLEYELKQKDEHILKIENENSFMRDERTMFDSNGMAVEPKLQQQALPVVPECVAVQIERVKNSNGNFATLGLFDWNHEAKPDYTIWIHENVYDFMRACTIGYTVKKPQLFYLRDELTGKFLAKDNQFKDKDRYFFWTGADPLTHSIGTAWKLTFTQQEIDIMQTGSYEQIEVTE